MSGCQYWVRRHEARLITGADETVQRYEVFSLTIREAAGTDRGFDPVASPRLHRCARDAGAAAQGLVKRLAV